MYKFLDYFFLIFHSSVILFNLFGWIWKKTRKANLIILLITAFSWFGLGLCYGFGYCFCTDWHWKIRLELGYTDMPNSYIKFLIDNLTGLNVDSVLVDILTLIFFLLALIISISLNVNDVKNKRKKLNFK